MSGVQNTSLLWPHGEPINSREWQDSAVTDLGLDGIIKTLNVDARHEREIKRIVLTPCDDAETIIYRQEIIDDLLSTPDLLAHFTDLLPRLSDLTYYATLSQTAGLPFQRTLGRIGELELYVQIVRALSAALNDAADDLRSAGLCSLRELLIQRIQDPIFGQIERGLPDITAVIKKLRSITIGVNLDHNLRPIAATLVSINTESFKGSSSSFFKKLFGEQPEFQGISQLHSVPYQAVEALDGKLVATKQRSDPMLFPLFKDLDRAITDIVRPIESAIREFLQVSTQFLSILEPEIVFYLGATRLISDLSARGLPLCRAEVADREARTCVVQDCYNLNLALRLMFRQPDANLADQIVCNDVAFDDNGRIFIITGPNQGGKTTYIQALALAQVLFQAGLYVPGSSARISPVDGIYSHFPVEEKPSAEAGRFGEEAQRLSDIFAHATRYSLILLNESLASTASGESLYLARDIVRCFRLLGVRAAYTTHMHELAANLDEFNAATPGDSKIISLVSGALVDSGASAQDAVKRTYKIIPSPPMGHSYAQELAARYGISFDKIVEKLTARHAIDPAIIPSS